MYEGSLLSRVYRARILSFFGLGAIVPKFNKIQVYMSPMNINKKSNMFTETYTDEPTKSHLWAIG